MTLSGSFKIEKNWRKHIMHVHERRILADFSKKPLVEIYLDLFGYVSSKSWIVPYAKSIQARHGNPKLFRSGELMRDQELIERGLHERFYDPKEEPVPIEKLREQRFISVNTFCMRGVSFIRHSSRTGTLLSDIASIAFDIPRLASSLRCSQEKVRMFLQAAFFMLGYLHDVGKMSRPKGSKDDVYYLYSLPRIYSDDEFLLIQGHIREEARAEAWERIFRVNPDTVPRIINIMGWLHHTYKNGDGYPKDYLEEGILKDAALNDIERFLLSVIKLIDETEAGTALDRNYKPKKKVSEISQEISSYAERGLVSERAIKYVSSLLIDDGGLSNISKLVKVPEIELILDNNFQNATIVFDNVIELLSRVAKDESTKGISRDIMRSV